MPIRGEAQIGQCVLDFSAFEEALAAVDAVLDVALDQLLFEVARLCVGAIQDRAVLRAAMLGDVFADALDHEARFVLFVVGGVKRDALAILACCPQLLAEAAAVAFDHAVGGLENVRGGAVVLFQLDRLRAGEIAQELLHVLHLGAAPAVDRLVVVTDHEDLPGGSREHTNPRVLQRVGVLEFVDQQITPALLVVLQHGWILQPKFVRAQQQFGEIDQPGAAAGVFIGLVDLHERAGDWMVAVLDALRTPTFVFPVVDLPAGLAWRKFRIVQAEPRDYALDQSQLIVGVEDLKSFRQTGFTPVPPQQAMRDTVERADGQALGAARNQRVQSPAHFAGGLVGERDGEDCPRRYPLGLGQPADAVSEYAGLAGAGAGQHQVVAGWGANGFALCVVERVDQVGDIHPAHCNGLQKKTLQMDGRSLDRRSRGAFPRRRRRWHSALVEETTHRQQAAYHNAGNAYPLWHALVVGGRELGRAELQYGVGLRVAGVTCDDPDAGHQQDDADDDQSCAHGCSPCWTGLSMQGTYVQKKYRHSRIAGKKWPRRLGGTFGAGDTKPRGEVCIRWRLREVSQPWTPLRASEDFERGLPG